MSNTKSRREIEAIVEALDDEPITAADERETVDALGIDVKDLASKMRAKVMAADARDREARYHEARKAYANEIARLERQKIAGALDREALRTTFRGLLKKAPPQAVAAHFHKYESVSDEELVELIKALRHLLGEDDSE